MDANELVRRFKLLGCVVNLANTGSSDYVRGFIVDPCGVSIGRATIHKGEFSHIKWYWRGDGDLVDTDFIMCQWCFMQWCGGVLPRELYDRMVSVAEELQRRDYQSKVSRRLEMPLRKRKAVRGKNIRSFLALPPKEDLMIELLQEVVRDV